ncbi:conserved hypothetical protein [uncultured Thiomicrorhabdus sp.]
MLWEYWQVWRTPVSLPYVKPMGFLHESIAMRARAKRCQTAWHEHYQHCQHSILQAIQLAEEQNKTQQKTALILGAGHLHDIPLEYFSQKFQQVVLVDLLFSQEARRQLKRFANIELVELDVTENLQTIYQGELESAQQLTPPQGYLKENIGLVVSLNLITQLPLLPAKYLMKHFGFTLQQAQEISQTLIQQHLAYLRRFECPVCLIADRNIEEFDRHNHCIDGYNPWWEVELPEAQESWQWLLAPYGEISRNRCQIHQVGVSYFQGNRELD